MKNPVTHWHKVAELFLERKLALPEIGKLMIINEAIGLVPSDKDAIKVGINVIDQSELYDSLVFGLLKRQPSDKTISYPELAALLDVTVRRIGLSVDRLNKTGVVVKEDRGRLGSVYEVHPEKFKRIPPWVTEFTAALIDLHNDAELKAQAAQAVSETEFAKGFQVFKQELREKFYRPRKQPNSIS